VIESKQPNLVESGAVFLQNLTTYEQGREFMIQHFNIIRLDGKKEDNKPKQEKIFDLYIFIDTYIFALENDFRYKIDIMHPIIENLIFYDLEKHISNEDFYNLFNCAVSKVIKCPIIDVVIVSLNLIYIYTKQKRYSDYVCENEKFIYTLFAYNHSKEYSDITTNIITNIIDNSIDKFHVKYGIDDIKIQGTSMFKPTKEFDNKVKARINEIKTHKCTLCDIENSNSRCVRCKKTYYCGKDCQTKDWANHKKTCVKI
jgi:hypothetical protein